MFKEHDIVMATKDLSKNVKQDCIGTIVLIYDKPWLAYEVEFFDDEDWTIELLTVQPSDIKLKN